MKFLKTYHNYKEKLNENKKQAMTILKKLHISKSNKEFTKITNELIDKFDNLNLLGLLTKFRFKLNVSMDEIMDLIKWLHDNNGNKLLPKPILQYKTFESLKDDIININNQRKVKLVMNELPSEQKSLVEKATDEEKSEFTGWCIKLHEIKNKSTLYNKISSIKSMEDMIDRLSDFVQKNLDIKDYDEKKKELEETPKVNIVFDDPDKGILMARILDYDASNKLGSSSWCISTGQGTWIDYIYKNMGFQYFIWDYSRSLADPLHHIGVTLGISDRVTHAHDVNDKCIKKSLPEVVKENIGVTLFGMTFDEAEKIKGEFRGETRKSNKKIYDNEESSKKLATILMEFLKSEGDWIPELDVYDITPKHDHYGLSSYEIDLIDEERSYCLGTEEEARDAHREFLEVLIDEYGILSWSQDMWEPSLDSESIWNYLETDIRISANNYIEEDEYESEDEHLQAIDDYVQSQKDEIYDDPLQYLQEWGYIEEKEVTGYYGLQKSTEWKSSFSDKVLFDRKWFLEAISGSRGEDLNGYDGTEETILFNDVWYYIYRTE